MYVLVYALKFAQVTNDRVVFPPCLIVAVAWGSNPWRCHTDAAAALGAGGCFCWRAYRSSRNGSVTKVIIGPDGPLLIDPWVPSACDRYIH